MTEVIQKIRLVSAEEGADALLVKAVRMALEEARQRFGIREQSIPRRSMRCIFTSKSMRAGSGSIGWASSITSPSYQTVNMFTFAESKAGP
jgi:hypothetical protein